MIKKAVVTLAVVSVLIAIMAVCLVSAAQLLEPRSMPFGVTGPSPVVTAVQQKISLDLRNYSSEADLVQAAERGDIYGGYVPGSSSDELVTVLRELLSNVARHAQASHVDVTVAVLHDLVWIEVVDDGVGPGHEPSTTGSGLGLRNLTARAERHGGSFTVGAAEGRGTVARWQVPC